jgi:hypothetical protein
MTGTKAPGLRNGDGDGDGGYGGGLTTGVAAKKTLPSGAA